MRTIQSVALARLLLAAREQQPINECDLRDAIAEGSIAVEDSTITIQPAPPPLKVRMFPEHTAPNTIWTGRKR